MSARTDFRSIGPTAPAAPVTLGSRNPPERDWRLGWEAVVLGLLGLGCGVSPFWHGLYDFSVWGPICIGLLVLAVALIVARPTLPRGPAALVLGALVTFALWSWISRGWSESTADAALATERWILYAAFFAVLAILLRTRGQATVLLGGATVGVVVIAGYVLARMTLGDGESLFLNGRLNDPLGYINGQAGLLLVGFWPLVAVAERRHLVWSPPAIAAATVVAGLLVLTQARGVVLGLAAATIVLLAAVPGRRDRIWALLAIGAATALAAGPLLDVYEQRGGTGLPPSDVIESAAGWLIVVSVGVGLIWAAVCAAAQRTQLSPDLGRRVRIVTDAALAALAVIALVAVVVFAGRIADRVRDQTHAFVHLRSDAGSSRLLSGGGYRYDFWRIALREFRDEPLHGVGAGNYSVDYFRQRQNSENITQPHSLELQVLAELGVVGGLLLLVLLAGVVAGFARRAVRAGADPWQRAIAVGAGGTFAAWLADTSVDWLHLIPGVAGVAFVAAAVLTLPANGAPAPAARRSGSTLAIAAVAVLAALGAVAVGRSVLALHLRSEGQQVLASNPKTALDKARDALGLESDSVPAYRLQAAAYARLGDYPRARASLLKGTDLEPSDFVNWALLGDLSSRRGYRVLARRYYRRALSLNRRDRMLAKLAGQPPVGG